MAKNIGIIGAGSWGTALSKMLAEKGTSVTLWCFEKEVAAGINKSHKNPLYIPDVDLPPAVEATTDLKNAVSGKEIVVSVIPSRFVREIWTKGAQHVDSATIIVSATKGIEADTRKLMSRVLADCLPSHPEANRVFLSGPSFAPEVARGLPTSVVIAGKDPAVMQKVQETFRTNMFLTFTNEDVIGVEVGGAVKNVIAIAAGMSDGLGFGHNARAAIITRGLYEMVKIGKSLGANPLTFIGLSGIGDLVLTCTADLSRNHTVGKRLGRGEALDAILKDMKMVAEGIPTAEAVYHLALENSINAPICEAMYRMLHQDLKPRDAATWLCSLPLKDELRSILR
jgi:glycerol-3-phosphate dehydrogenase (NAD(P)+)